MKTLKFFLCAGVSFLMATSCTKKMQDYDGFALIYEDPETDLAIFEIEGGKQGAAAIDGKILIEPEYTAVGLCGKFISATKFDETATENLEYYDEGIGQTRLFDNHGKMLKDFTESAFTNWFDAMGDTILWGVYNASDDSYQLQLIGINGDVTDIYEFSTDSNYYTYTIKGKKYFKRPGEEPNYIDSPNIARCYEMYVAQFYDETMPYYRVYLPNGAEVNFGEGWRMRLWTEGPQYNGMFVEIFDDKNDKTAYLYITEDGIADSLPEGYRIGEYVGNYGGTYTHILQPNGRPLSGYGTWHGWHGVRTILHDL